MEFNHNRSESRLPWEEMFLTGIYTQFSTEIILRTALKELQQGFTSIILYNLYSTKSNNQVYSRIQPPVVFCKKGVLKISQILQENNFIRVSFWQNSRAATLFKKRQQHSCFPVNFAKLLRTPLLKNTSSGCFWY